MAAPAHDVFVSYARADDEPPLGATRGWVTTLADELRKLLRRKLGVREARVFMDHQLAGNEGLTDGLRKAILGSRTLVLFMSPGYLKSKWCQRELGEFLDVQTERNHRDHVFVVETEPLDREGWHPRLQELIPIRFWHREFEDKAPRLMGFPAPKLDEENPYWRNLNELAHLIAKQLEDEVPSLPPRPKVWLAEPTEDLLAEHESVVATLRQQGFEPVPTGRLPREGQEPYLRTLRTCLDQAVLGIQLLGGREGHVPEWGRQSFVALQAQESEARSRARSFPLLRWRSRNLDLDEVKNAEYRALLTGGNVLALGIEEFKQEILRALKMPVGATPSPRPPPPAEGTAPHVYVNAESVDRDLGRRVQEALESFGATSALPPVLPSNELPGQVRRAQQVHLEACDGLVLVYGQASPTWVYSQWDFARRTLASQGRIFRAAVLDGPPPEKPDLGLRGPNILALDCRTGFDPAALGVFVGSLRSGAPHA